MSNLKCPNIKIYKCSDGFVTDNAQVAKSHEANIKSNKLICPFCGEKIEHIEDGWCNCKNRCTGSGSIELWLQFLRTRKQLEMANAELDYIKEQVEKNGAFDNTRKALDVAVDALKEIKDGKIPVSLGICMDINDALEQITALEQKDAK